MKQHHKDVPGSGGHGSRQGTPKLNKKLQTLMPNIERSSHTADHGVRVPQEDGWPSMFDLARSMTSGKWGKTGKDKKVGN